VSTPTGDVASAAPVPAFAAPGDRRRRPAIATAIWLTVATVGWAAIAVIAASLLASHPPSAAFDLELLLRAARAVAAGGSPYDPSIVAGRAPDAVGLFFSYPPPVAQVLVPLAGLPSWLVFLGWSVAAVALLGLAVRRLAFVIEGPTATVLPGRVVATVAATIGLAALTFPFVIAILFGNLDAFFPALYGLALVAALSNERRDRIVGGIAVGVAAATKLYPAGLGLWFAVRAVRDRRAVAPLAAVVATAVVLLLGSLAVGGLAPWQEYSHVLSAATRSELVDVRNVAPAAQIALLIGGDSALARLLQVPITGLAILAIGWAALARRDPVESLAIAAAATLVLLPISWIHYPAAMIPFAAAAVVRTAGAADRARGTETARSTARAVRDVRSYVAAAIVFAATAVVILPLMWVAVALCVAAAHRSVRFVTR
jgi:hypothetical protein